MDRIRQRLDRDLTTATSRLRRLGGAVTIEKRSDAIGHSPCADEVDEMQMTSSREIGLATRERLTERVNRLSAALDRLDDGAYGICADCAEPISPARMRVIPEVQTCVRGESGVERRARADRLSTA